MRPTPAQDMSTGVHDAVSLTTANVIPESAFQRRLRHISSIQVRNLTPFPIRDAFASALVQPAEYSQFTPLGNLSDDLDVTLSSRKRPRRISINSLNTFRTTQVDDHPSKFEDNDGRGRRRAQSGVSFSGGESAESVPKSNAISRTISTSATAPTVRPRNRVRTTSMVSSLSASTINALSSVSIPQAPSTSTTVSSSSLFFDYSQRTLERVVQSRLVETFISITVPNPPDIAPCPTPSPDTIQRTRAESAPRSSSSNSTSGNNYSTTSVRKASKISRPNSMESSKAPFLPRGEGSASNHSSISIRKGTPPVKTNAAPLTPRILPRTHKPSASVPPKLTASQLPSPPASPASPGPPPLRTVPNYISAIHQPSTNPSFMIDAQSPFEFAPWTDLSADTIKIELWMKFFCHPTGGHLDGKGKQKEMSVTDRNDLTGEGAEWSVLEEWNITLADLVPLTPELEAHPSRLPSNTLFISFSTSLQTFYLPTRPLSPVHPRSRSPSPAAYSSEPETELRKFGHPANQAKPTHFHLTSVHSEHPSEPRRSRRTGSRTSSSQDLLQLVTLRSCIIDNEASLVDVIRQIDVALDNDVVATLKREASEREAYIDDQRSEAKEILKRASRLREDIASRCKKIRERREFLAAARSIQSREQANLEQTTIEVTEHKQSLDALQSRLPPIRTSLVSTLSRIFPIELLSPSELLFTILSVPLPIPFKPTEPAPPLSLASHKEVTEDVVATALGFAAQLVQLLAIYMGKGLTYPITCIGSRSLIRDNISAMVGPRMFPLFSKGVDTYRFEYAVFLLNKDIEMLMADRDLRALDMRHTLPNLKNLLLTLTDGECASIRNSRVSNSPVSSGLTTPLRAQSPPPALVLTSNSPNDEHNASELHADAVEAEVTTSSESRATTPTASTDGGTFTRYSKISIGFPPLPGFLRSRNASTMSRVSLRSDPEAVEEAQGGVTSELSSETVGDDEDDRRTIRGVVVCGEEAKAVEGEVRAQEPVEKRVDNASTAMPCAMVAGAT